MVCLERDMKKRTLANSQLAANKKQGRDVQVSGIKYY
ncbi:hypothetical protein RAZWK3B_00955 [Roseobacter sp. AzwK-3b]|nr:hypothetical protein RAZWK3B_00955 [Roseobacter sp. AzwK-3b]